MQYVITLNFLLSLMAAGVLYLVWRRDTSQPFTRDFAMVLLFSCLAGTFLALFQFGPAQYKSLFLWANIAAGAAIQVRLYAALWHLGHPQISGWQLWWMYLGVLCVFLALSYGGTMQRVGPVASALEVLFGAYCIRAYWKAGWAERMIGFGTIGTGFTLVFVESSVADWAMVAMAFQQVSLAFAFAYAAMDRSAARSEHQRERFERVREQQQRDRAAAAELVQREKLAALGRMVAGIAHELNTPIGIALTAGSHLRDQALLTQTQLDAGQLRASGLKDFLADSFEGAQMLEKALHQAERLLSSFRLVAQDHSHEGCAPFSLSALMLEVETLVRPGLDTTSIALHFDVQHGVDMHSFPGHVSQVVVQLVDNAKLHAFAQGTAGRIDVTAHRDADTIEIVVSDNGRGIAPDLLPHIFDPFFTTRMGRSQGLGLNTVHSMVTRKLGGSITVVSSADAGTRFAVRLPFDPTDIPSAAIA
jgi:signal transduction histidine kinase